MTSLKGGFETRVNFRRRNLGVIQKRSGAMRLAEIRLQEGESIDNALRRFKRKVQTEDIIKEVKRHSYYLKPGAEAAFEAGSCAKACSKEDSQRIRLSD